MKISFNKLLAIIVIGILSMSVITVVSLIKIREFQAISFFNEINDHMNFDYIEKRKFLLEGDDVGLGAVYENNNKLIDETYKISLYSSNVFIILKNRYRVRMVKNIFETKNAMPRENLRYKKSGNWHIFLLNNRRT